MKRKPAYLQWQSDILSGKQKVIYRPTPDSRKNLFFRTMKINHNGIRKSMAANFNSAVRRIQHLDIKDQNLARFLEDLRQDISTTLCIYEPGDELYSDLSEEVKLIDIDPIYIEDIPF